MILPCIDCRDNKIHEHEKRNSHEKLFPEKRDILLFLTREITLTSRFLRRSLADISQSTIMQWRHAAASVVQCQYVQSMNFNEHIQS